MLIDYIKKNWDSCVRLNTEDNDTLIGLPYPYIVPSVDPGLNEMYYWDTFFTCKGLLLSNRTELVKNCTDNMLFLVDKYGFMPNGNRTYYLSQSQPPFLSMMVMDVYKEYRDKQWLKSAYKILKKEYDFWQTKRITPIGLNQFGANEDNLGDVDKHYESICRRINYCVPMNDHKAFARNFLADCESGWDFNPRCEFKQSETVYVDLNSNLYLYEKNFEYFSREIGAGEELSWLEAAEKRQELMNKYLWNETFFADYNFKESRQSELLTIASFYPLWAGVASNKQAQQTLSEIGRIECEYGVATTEKHTIPGEYQWGYPNGWAPLQYIVTKALLNYGFYCDAKRIAEKYINSTEHMFERTGKLWEKYNVLTGDNDVVGDYGVREMLGWTAGVYMFCKDVVDKIDSI